MNKTDLITVRDAVPDDKNFIFSTWLRGLRYGNEWFELIDKNVYYKVYHVMLEKIVTSGVEIKIACLKEDPSVILGYAVYSGKRLDWLFVKKAWRGIGIARMLIPANIERVSHITQVGKSLLRKLPNAIFDPFTFP